MGIIKLEKQTKMSLSDLIHKNIAIVEPHIQEAFDDVFDNTAVFIDDAMNKGEEDSLPEDALAQWSAGFLYAASSQIQDKRDYLVECSLHSYLANRKLNKAYTKFAED